jgi:hypothetical protein
MLHFIGGIMGGLIGVIAALSGIGIGLGALMLAFAPLILLILILMLPVLILVSILRRIGILGGPFMSLIAIIVLIFLLLGGAHHLWQRGTDNMQDWIEAKRDELEECRRQGGDNVTVTWDDGDLIFTCNGRRKQGTQPGDAHI